MTAASYNLSRRYQKKLDDNRVSSAMMISIATIKETMPVFLKEHNKEVIMKKYTCDVCGYVYDPAIGDPDSDIAAGTAFEDLPDDWTCPICGAAKDQFSPMD